MSAEKNNGIFATLYCTRIMVNKGGAPIINLSLLFCIIAVLTAPWLVIGGTIAALALGYKFGLARNAQDFCGSFDTVVREAKDNVRSAVETISGSDGQQP